MSLSKPKSEDEVACSFRYPKSVSERLTLAAAQTAMTLNQTQIMQLAASYLASEAERHGFHEIMRRVSEAESMKPGHRRRIFISFGPETDEATVRSLVEEFRTKAIQATSREGQPLPDIIVMAEKGESSRKVLVGEVKRGKGIPPQ
jgi:hypothetical protein